MTDKFRSASLRHFAYVFGTIPNGIFASDNGGGLHLEYAEVKVGRFASSTNSDPSHSLIEYAKKEARLSFFV